MDRIVLLGSVIVDVVLVVPGLPRRGGDVLADDGGLATGGGHNVLSAAARQGLPGALAGRHGTGPFGDLARRDLAAAGVELLLPRTPDGDTGFCVGFVEPDGERTYATHPGVDDSPRARSRTAGVHARLERAVQRGTPCQGTSLGQRMHLGVRLPGSFVGALADHHALVGHDTGPHQRVRRRASQAAQGVLECPTHPTGVVYHFS